MKHKTSQALYTYWNEIRGQRIAPRRFEIEPSRIASFLPDTFILDCSEPDSFRFRLAGTRMSSLLGRDVRDSDMLNLFASEERGAIRRILQQTLAQAPVTVLTFQQADLGTISIRGYQLELLLLPLFHTQNAVTRLLGCAVPLDPQATTRLRATDIHTLLDTETIWPDGRPHAILDHMNRQSPFAPGSQAGRLVSSDRRRFRVFNGGKSI